MNIAIAIFRFLSTVTTGVFELLRLKKTAEKIGDPPREDRKSDIDRRIDKELKR